MINKSLEMLNNFPSKYSTLPKIPDLPNTDLVPYKDGNILLSHLDPIDRVNELETRLNITEKSNRALLDEVVRLHNEFRTITKQYEDAFREERVIRSFLENNYKNSQDKIKNIESRLESTEHLLNQERSNIRELSYQSKNFEDLISSSKKDSSVLNDRQLSKLAQLEREMEILNDNRNKMERISFQLVDEMKMMKSKLEAQSFDFTAMSNELRNKSKKMENDYQQNIDVVKKHLSKNENTNDSAYRSIVEQKLMELKDNLNQIRIRHDDEVNDRRTLEKTVMSKFSEIAASVNEQTRAREEIIREMQYAQRERDHKIEAERLLLQNKFAEMAEQINAKVMEKDLRFREEQMKRQSDMEKLLRSEQESRMSYEREIRVENDRRYESINQMQIEELKNIKDSIKHDKLKYVDSIKRLDEALSILERQIDGNKIETTKLISAEIQTRSSSEKTLKGRISEIEEKILNASSIFQHGIAGMTEKSGLNNDKIQKLVNDYLEDYKAGIKRQLADLDIRILNLQSPGTTRNLDDVDEKIRESVGSLNMKLVEKIEIISLAQVTIETNIAQLKIQKQQLKQEIYELNELVGLAKSEAKGRIEAEMNSRVESEELIRQDMEKLKQNIPKDIVSKEDLNKVKVTSRKLAESMQTIKTVLGMKIQSEQNLRIEEIKQHQEELTQLKTLIEPIIFSMNSARREGNNSVNSNEPDANDDSKRSSDDQKEKKGDNEKSEDENRKENDSKKDAKDKPSNNDDDLKN